MKQESDKEKFKKLTKKSPKKTKSRKPLKKSVKKSCRKSRALKLVSIAKSPKKDKKLMATFCRSGRIKQIHFGASGYKNYCGPSGKGKDCHNSAERRRRYLARHKSRENFNKPDSAGSLSAHILWGKGTISSNIASFKRRFNL